MASTMVRRKFHFGLVNVSDGKCRPQPARLKVCPEFMVLQREEIIFPDDDDSYPTDNKLRHLRLKRQSDGSLGISIKGGTDHNLPILISKVCRNEEDDHLYIGDAIVRVNHTSVANVSHDEAINILRNAGAEVTLTVKHYRSAAPFLLKNFRQLIPEQESNGATESIDGNRNATSGSNGAGTLPGSNRDPRHSDPASTSKSNSSTVPSRSNQSPVTLTSTIASTSTTAGGGEGGAAAVMIESPSSVTSAVSDASTTTSTTNWNGIPRVKRKWVDVVEVPLMMAYITRYIFGTDKIRPNSFEVRGMNGSHTGVIHSPDLAVLSHWIKLISDYINGLTGIKGMAFNQSFPQSEQISYMSWLAEGVLNRNQPWQNWKPKFFALRGSEVCVFEKPPLEAADWTGPNVQCYKVYAAMFRVIKESENVDERQHCFLIQTTGGESRYFSMETRAELLRVESAWHRAVCHTVSDLGSKTFHVVYRNIPAAFTIDWIDGFLLKQFATVNYQFIYAFSQLKSSSDDGNATLKLEFVDPPGTRELVIQELICPKLQDLLFYMHAFLTAKVASLDPSFLNRGRIS